MKINFIFFKYININYNNKIKHGSVVVINSVWFLGTHEYKLVSQLPSFLSVLNSGGGHNLSSHLRLSHQQEYMEIGRLVDFQRMMTNHFQPDLTQFLTKLHELHPKSEFQPRQNPLGTAGGTVLQSMGEAKR